MNVYLIDGIGYVALVTNLFSMSSKGEFKLRVISFIANILYIFYGALIGATPVIIGCIIAVCLHGYHIRRLQMLKISHD